MTAEPTPQRALDRVAAGVFVVLIAGLLSQLFLHALAVRFDFEDPDLETIVSLMRWNGAARDLVVGIGLGVAGLALWRIPAPARRRLARPAAVLLGAAIVCSLVRGVIIGLNPEWQPTPSLRALGAVLDWGVVTGMTSGWLLAVALAHRGGDRKALSSAAAALALVALATLTLLLRHSLEIAQTLHAWSPGHSAALMVVVYAVPLWLLVGVLRAPEAAAGTVLADPSGWAEVCRGARLVRVATLARLLVGLFAGVLAIVATRRALPALYEVTTVAQALTYAVLAAGCLRLRRVPDVADLRLVVTAAAALFAGLALLDLAIAGPLTHHPMRVGTNDSIRALFATAATVGCFAALLLLAAAARMAHQLGEGALAARCRAVAWGLAGMVAALLVLIPELSATINGDGGHFAEPMQVVVASTLAISLGVAWTITAVAKLFGRLADTIAARVAGGGAPTARATLKNPD